MKGLTVNLMTGKKSVALIHPENDFLIDPMVFPPLALLYLSASLKEIGVDVEVFDLNDPSTELDDVSEADVYGFTSTTPQWGNTVQVFRKLKNQFPGKTFVAGGPHPTVASSDASMFDATVVGDGEIAVRKVLEGERGAIRYPVQDIDKVPAPDREALDLHRYRYLLDGEETTTAVTSRGCPYSCAFCSRPQEGVRFHSPERVRRELEEIKSLGFGGVQIFDDIFMLDRERLEEICHHLDDLGLKYRCMVRANIAKKRDLELLKETGCVEVGCGFESSSQRILDNIGKRTTVKQQRELIQNCRDIGLRIKAFYIVGLPGESHETLEETERFIESNKCNDYDFSVLAPMPGSEIYEDPERYDIELHSNDTSTWYKGTPGNYSVNISTTDMDPGDLQRWRKRLENRFKPEEKLTPYA